MREMSEGDGEAESSQQRVIKAEMANTPKSMIQATMIQSPFLLVAVKLALGWTHYKTGKKRDEPGEEGVI